jgi:HK97 family phage portal protein
MPLIRAARDTFRQARNGIENPAVPLTSTALLEWLGGPPSASGVRVTEQSALGMTAVWRSVNLIGGTCAALPLHAYRRTDDVRLPASDGSQASKLLAAPHPDLTPFEFWEIVFAHLLLWGNAYLRVLRNRLGVVQELWPIHPGRVRAGRESETGTKVYLVDDDPDSEYTDEKILHIPGFGYDGICGVSPIRLSRQGIGLALAAEEYGARLFGNGSLAAGILQTEQRLEQTQADALKARWKARAAGIANAHDVVVLDSGAKFQQLTIPPEDAQFIETRGFQIEEIARMFGIPPHMLAQVEKQTSWGTGVEQQSISFIQYTLQPWLTRVEQRISRLLNPQAVYARFGVEGLLRGDSAARAAFYQQMWNIGVFSTNDILRLEDREPVGPKGDVRYRPLNMGELGAPDPQPEPTPAPASAPADDEVPADA